MSDDFDRLKERARRALAGERKSLHRPDLVRAAVLVPFVRRGGAPFLVLTRRTMRVATHKGQISFPGGAAEPEDADFVATALREAREEIGLDPALVEVVGALSDGITTSGFVVTPVVGFLAEGAELAPQEIEVAEVFEVPFARILDPAVHRLETFEHEGASVTSHTYEVDGRRIWGATGRIIAKLIAALAMCAGCAGGGGTSDAGTVGDAGTDASTDEPDAGPTSVVWPNDESFANSDPWLPEHHGEIDVLRPRVLALNFVNARSMEEMEAQLTEMIEVVAEASCHDDCGDGSVPALQYELAYAVDLRDPVPPDDWPYNNSTLYPREDPVEGFWGFDYERLFTEELAALYGIADPEDPDHVLDLCELFDLGLVHEVWVYGDADVPDVSAAEILERKPYYDEDRVRIPVAMNRCAGNGCFDVEDGIPCDRTVRIAWFNNTRGPGCFLESLSHGFESTGAWNPAQIPYLSRYFVPFANYALDVRYGLPFDSWYSCDGPGCLSYPDATSVSWQVGDESGAIDPYDPVCGNVHFMPNGTEHYDLTSPYTVETSCRHFRDGTGETDPFDSSIVDAYSALAPDCMGKFLVWWRRSFPGKGGDHLDDDGEPMLSFWPFIYY